MDIKLVNTSTKLVEWIFPKCTGINDCKFANNDEILIYKFKKIIISLI